MTAEEGQWSFEHRQVNGAVLDPGIRDTAIAAYPIESPSLQPLLRPSVQLLSKPKSGWTGLLGAAVVTHSREDNQRTGEERQRGTRVRGGQR